jgi:RNase adaptor protein for sRNA GlmZ degradation
VSDARPLAVLVSGAPGSGKTTLARMLGEALDLPVLHKDQLVHGVWRTLGRGTELGLRGVEIFYRTMETWLESGTSFVADQTFYRGVSEADVAARLAPRARLLHVHCRSPLALERFEQRMRDDPLCGEHRLQALLPLAARLQGELTEPLDFGCESIVVDTTDGWTPSVDEVVQWIDERYARPTMHDLDQQGRSEE